MKEIVVRFRLRTIFTVLAAVLVVALLLHVLSVARQVLVWILIALFLTMAINPAVDWLQRRGVKSRALSVLMAMLGVLLAISAIGALFIPTLIDQVNNFANALPGYVANVTSGRGRLGFLEQRYDIVERVRAAVQEGGAAKVFGFSGIALTITKSIITFIVGTVTVIFLTVFMLLEGPDWIERTFNLVPERSRARWRKVGQDIYQTVGGYVTGNLVISLIAGTLTTVVLLAMRVPYAVALGLVVAILDLIPLAGATIAAVIVGTVAFLHGIPAGIVVVTFFILYQQLENHILQPLVYGRTVQLSPLVVLISVLIGAQVAGVLGALAAIPVAGAIQVLVRDWLANRTPTDAADEVPPAPIPGET
ncbi:MAG: AI-2E family transporter [Actinomycetota bacterium]|nr:AI-2E family transporter [Actinomycetota bacterium]